ncbi:MAG: transcription-repair coupling factor [Leptospiraceae bacterium]|nr:transcription-repair coupling factor [Leptospiraceae bacterium]
MFLSEKLKTLDISKDIQNQISIKGLDLYSIPDASSTFIASLLYHTLSSNSVFLVYPTNLEAEAAYRELFTFVDSSSVHFLPGNDTIPYEYAHIPPDTKRDRIYTLSQLFLNQKSLIVTSVSGFVQKVPGKDFIFSESIVFKKNDDYDLEDILRKFIQLGYERRQICDHYGTFSVKGGIIDIFPSHLNTPVRLDFFGDQLENIKSFDPDSQKSLSYFDSIPIYPVDEYALSDKERDAYFKLLESDSHLIKPEERVLIVEEIVPLIREGVGILEYFTLAQPHIILVNPLSVKDKTLQMFRELNLIYESKKDEYLLASPTKQYSFENEYNFLTSNLVQNTIRLNRLPPPEDSLKIPFLYTKEIPEFKGKIREAREYIESQLQADEPKTILLTSSFIQQTDRLESLFATHKIQRLNKESEEPLPVYLPKDAKTKFFIALSELRKGFEIPELNVIILTENDIFGRKYKRKTRYKKTASSAIESFLDLKEGDFVVHINHGVGRFKKIERVTADNKQRDFLKLEYAGQASLYVPLDQISLVQRYIGGSDHPKLDALGKSNWKKTKERVREAVEKLAEDLVRLYANRLKLSGYSFPKDTIWQEEFEADFEYEETPDQLTAIDAVKADLESSKPMDRLVCGDVGYGKTEVAIRAAFKVIMAGKQALLLCPTTILALQHFNTFSERYKNYPIKVGFVSRFKTITENKESFELYAKGELDFLVGTHALLSTKLKPKNLGLLIIDEEQKFGVNHKETIKKLKNLVDVLTLTATPIPRTLHMALSGIRDLSIISTPPKNRQSVETYVMEENDEVLQKAIRREIDRGGQVFYLYNRVESIEAEANFVSSLVPDLSVGILHGQMDEEFIEQILLDFYHRKYDILVTTTIIESGIDMPNVNTLIIRRADTFGLSQLYQLRGRVGRSDRKAYAYLIHPRGRVLTEQAEKRLNTIYEYQELGSGFKVAMRDLEIRGAGNLLGSEQSGDIAEIGFDLYVRMLDEAIAKIKGIETEIEIRTSINLSANFYLPDEYIPDTKQKIEFYKKWEGCTSLDDLEIVKAEMIDRFGEPPLIAQTFLLLESIRTIASSLGIESLNEVNEEIKIKSGADFRGDPNSVVRLISRIKGLSIHPSEPTVLRLNVKGRSEEEKLTAVQNLLLQIEPSKKSKNKIDNMVDKENIS